MKFEDTKEYRNGRAGEIVMHAFAIEHGCTAFDIGGTARGAAPMFQHRKGNIIATDALLIRNHVTLNEFKTKTNTHNWNGGNRQIREAGGMPPCLAHGIDRRLLAHYQTANQKTPVILWFLTLNTGMMHVASLDELGEPYDSVQPELHPMVNWPLNRMHRVATFNSKQLFAYARTSPRQILTSQRERQGLLRSLRPVQLEFESFIEHFLTISEHRWASRAN